MGTSPGRVIVVGSVNIDLVVTTARLPGPGETVIGGRFARHHGGKGANQAVAAARLGAATVFVGAVGGDAFAHEARDALGADGVDVTGLVTLDDVPTGVALIVVDAAGENSIAVASGANAGLTAAHVEAALDRLAIGPADVVLVGLEIPTATAGEALRLGRMAGATTILNPAPATAVDAGMAARADVLTPNRGELAAIAGDDGPEAAVARRLASRLAADPVARGPLAGRPRGVVFVSLGAEGALLVDGDDAIAIAAPRVDAVDAVGAGDTLNGALAAGLADGLDLATAATRAVTAASLAVTRAGAREGMPTVAELEAFRTR